MASNEKAVELKVGIFVIIGLLVIAAEQMLKLIV